VSRLNHLCRYIHSRYNYPNLRRIVAMALAATVSTAALAACGYKGSLVLPEPLPEPQGVVIHFAAPTA